MFLIPIGVNMAFGIIPVGINKGEDSPNRGFMAVRMAGYEKEPVHGIPEVAKCDQPNGDVGATK